MCSRLSLGLTKTFQVHSWLVWKMFQSIFSSIRPILVRMLRTKKKPTVAVAITTSAIQKAMSQLCCLAMVLKGRPAMKAPTGTQTNLVSRFNDSELQF